MPRRKAEDGAELQEESTKPEGISDEAWRLGRAMGNVSLASAILEVSAGERAPKSGDETTALVKASSDIRTRALNRYTRLRDGIGQKLIDAFNDYERANERTNRLTRLFADPDVLVREHGANGQDGSETRRNVEAAE